MNKWVLAALGAFVIFIIVLSGLPALSQVQPAVIKGSEEIAALKKGILGGSNEVVPIQADEFQPNATVMWGCWTVEDIIDILSPDKSTFQFLFAEKYHSGKCFHAHGEPFRVMQLERMTLVPAEGDRPNLVIWSMRDVTGAIAYATWVYRDNEASPES